MFRLVKHDLVEFAGSEAREEPIGNENARGEETNDAGAPKFARGADFKGAFGREKSRDVDWNRGVPETVQTEDMENEICRADGGGD